MSFVADTRTGALTLNQDLRDVTGDNFFILSEDDSFLLLEDGSKIIIDNPSNPVIFNLDTRNF